MEQITQLLPTCKQAIGLYLVATPIGNLQDITLRALTTLKNADIIACEDTRVTSQLLKHFGIHTTLICYNDFSTPQDRSKLIGLLAEGKSVALVSDAGTPLISDPGYKLVKEVSTHNYPIYPIPGPCAAISALTLSALPCDQFYFVGFLPSKSQTRRNHLAPFKGIETSFIFYESPLRLTKTLHDLLEVFGDKPCAIGRELTKRYEQIKRGTVSSLIEYYEAHPPKGECIIVFSNQGGTQISADAVDQMITDALGKLSAKDAAATVSQLTGLPKKDIYQRILTLLPKQR